MRGPRRKYRVPPELAPVIAAAREANAGAQQRERPALVRGPVKMPPGLRAAMVSAWRAHKRVEGVVVTIEGSGCELEP